MKMPMPTTTKEKRLSILSIAHLTDSFFHAGSSVNIGGKTQAPATETMTAIFTFMILPVSSKNGCVSAGTCGEKSGRMGLVGAVGNHGEGFDEDL